MNLQPIAVRVAQAFLPVLYFSNYATDLEQLFRAPFYKPARSAMINDARSAKKSRREAASFFLDLLTSSTSSTSSPLCG